MYFSGVITAFTISFFIFYYQGSVRRRNGGNETVLRSIVGALFGSIIFSVFSWFMVLIGLIINRGVWGLNGEW